MKSHPAIDALTRKKTTVGPVEMRPLTLGSFNLCQRAGIKMLEGQVGDTARLNYEVTAFAFIHSRPLDEVLDALDDGEKAFRRAVDVFAMGLQLSDLAALSECVVGMVKDSMSTLVVPVKPDEENPDEFSEKNKRGRRGQRP